MHRVVCLVLLILYCVPECWSMTKEELEDFSNYLLKTSQLDLQVKKGVDPDFDLDENEIISDNAWEESGKFEGDLILNDRQRRLIVENVEGLSRNGLTDSTKRWPNNEVIYFIQREHFNSGQVQAIENGINDLAGASCIKFRPYRKGDRDAVVIQGSRPGCFSQVGYQGGYQVLNLSGRHPVGRGCFRHGTVVHELLHSLGFYHMQSSPDRDDYIDVVWANIVQPARHNFRKYNSFSVSDFGVGYDYDSVLHYSRKAFSANGQDTLIPKQRGASIGQRVGLSDKDTEKLNRMYCDANNEPFLLDDDTPKKPAKKKPKNQPFQGQGIGYHQGKLLVIKLPVAQSYKLSNVPSTSVFDFSKTPQVSTPEAEGYRFEKEMIYSFKPKYSLNSETISGYSNGEQKQLETESLGMGEEHFQVTAEKPDTIKDKIHTNVAPTSQENQNEEGPTYYAPIDDYEQSLIESYDKLTKVKQRVYPKNQHYHSKINKDYSEFYSPSKPGKSHVKDLISYSPPKPLLEKQVYSYRPQTLSESDNKSVEKVRDKIPQDRMDHSYRTSLPFKKPYSFYTQTETPKYATREYLEGREDFSDIYSPKSSSDGKNKYSAVLDEPSSEVDNMYKCHYNMKPQSPTKLYTYILTENSAGTLKKYPYKENSKEEFRNIEISDPQRKVDLRDKMDSSYRTSFSTPGHHIYGAYVQTETPQNATLEYLKGRHNFSIYSPKRPGDGDTEEQNVENGTDRNWYSNGDYTHDPPNHDDDKDPYIDYNNRNDEDENGNISSHIRHYNGLTNRSHNNKNMVKSSENTMESKENNYGRGFDYRDDDNNYYEKRPTDDVSYYDNSDENSGLTRNGAVSDNEGERNSKESLKSGKYYTLYGDSVPNYRDSSEDDYS